jgi:hypothetical protein
MKPLSDLFAVQHAGDRWDSHNARRFICSGCLSPGELRQFRSRFTALRLRVRMAFA